MRNTNPKGKPKPFDYEAKMWGGHEVGLSPWFMGATRLKYALAALSDVLGGKVLEIGCGGGAFTRALKRHRPDLAIFGCDLSRKSIEIAKKSGGGVSYRQADAYKLFYQSNSFDALVSFDVWEHLDKPKQAFNEAHRVLKSGGVFHFFVPTEGERLSLYQLAPRLLYRTKQKFTGHVQEFSRESLMELLTKVGFVVERMQGSCFYFYQIVDLAYFSFLGLRGRNVSQSVEGYLASAPRKPANRVLASIAGWFSRLTYWENVLVWWLPPGGVHVTAIRKDK
jgi:ubiquinone/menaquinone biosynthesis C-methylase UbiE